MSIVWQELFFTKPLNVQFLLYYHAEAVIARREATKQSSLLKNSLGCRATLAMTRRTRQL
jgi:hypothetical protein